MSATPQTYAALPTMPPADAPAPPIGALSVEDYTRVRELCNRLFNQVFQDIARTSLPDAAKALGLAPKGKIPKLPQNLFALLADFGIYDHYLGGSNALQRFLKRTPPPTGPLELEVVDAVTHPRFSLYTYVRKLEDNTHLMFDVLHQETCVLFDTALGNTPMPPSVMLAARALPIRGMLMTGGGVMVMPTALIEILQQRLAAAGFEDFAAGKPRPRKGERLAEAHAAIIKTGLQLAAANAARQRVVR